ncbi:MAG: 2-amino-4-hydroxy-6-hydroxymethyldihydropteridine diphosphokinase [Phycisphaerales bacterium]|nr:2-amino-4-hydroxy-6-hydroxymethyldihydropteridine diphosphokinase [Phycisphaerales bacterium]
MTNPARGSGDDAPHDDFRLAAVALGSNLGDRRANLHAAAARLVAIPATHVVRVSGLFETAAVAVAPGVDPGPGYLNAAAVLRTGLSPSELLCELHGIERALGRDRATQAHGRARVIDLDLLLMDDLVMNSAELTLPHPRMHERAFVLRPLAEVAPNMVIPTLKRTVAEMLKKLGNEASDAKEGR